MADRNAHRTSFDGHRNLPKYAVHTPAPGSNRLLGLEVTIMGMAPKHEQIASLSDDELIARYNSLAESTVVGTAFYREELARRHLARESARMLSLTNTMKNLTGYILGLTAANALLVLYPLLKA